MNITDFLLARIADDETLAKYVLQYGDRGTNPNLGPARVLAECAAKRAIVEPFAELANGRDRLCDAYLQATYKMILRAVILPLATVYADHPDYRREWRP